MKAKRWMIAEPDAGGVRRLAQEMHCAPLTAAVLSARGIENAAAARAFLSCARSGLHDPFAMHDMDRAVGVIRGAIERGERIVVYGDYDVDGITATCTLVDYLRTAGAVCEYYIPNRLSEGYGLTRQAMEELYRRGTRLMITVDSGITANEEIALARELGMKVVITDHHECHDELPEAEAVIDCKQAGDTYPFDSLAGVGVAFKLICALDGDTDAMLDRYADLVALGTVADVMPIVGENRILVAEGLQRMEKTRNIGLQRLLAEAGMAERHLTASTISFVLAPRINAAGRMGKADLAAELFLTQDMDRAIRLAVELCEQNKLRQTTENEILNQALTQLRGEYDPAGDKMIVLAGKGWHQGVIGIAASRLSEEFHLPTIMICCDGERGKGSCRSFGGFNLYNALSACSEYLEGFGGHALAAGLTIRRENIDRFRRALGEYYRQNPADDLPELTCDLRVNDPHLLTMPCIESLDALEPCGNGNPKPLLCITGARLVNAVPSGGGRHLRLHFAKGGYNYAGIFFSCTPAELGVRIGQWVDVAFTPQINEFRGRRSVQLLVTDVRPSDPLPLCRALLKNQSIPAWDTVDLYPLRADFAVAWRWLSAPVSFPLGELPTHAPMRPEKFCVCLRVMAEMGLAAVDFDGETLRLRPLPTSGKVDLSASKLLQTLRERRQNLL